MKQADGSTNLVGSMEPSPTAGELRGRAMVAVPTLLETKRRLGLHHGFFRTLAARYKQLGQDAKSTQCEKLATIFEAAEMLIQVAGEEVKETLT